MKVKLISVKTSQYNYKISNQVPSHRAFSPFAQSIQSLRTGHSVGFDVRYGALVQGLNALDVGIYCPSAGTCSASWYEEPNRKSEI